MCWDGRRQHKTIAYLIWTLLLQPFLSLHPTLWKLHSPPYLELVYLCDWLHLDKPAAGSWRLYSLPLHCLRLHTRETQTGLTYTRHAYIHTYIHAWIQSHRHIHKTCMQASTTQTHIRRTQDEWHVVFCSSHILNISGGVRPNYTKCFTDLAKCFYLANSLTKYLAIV